MKQVGSLIAPILIKSVTGKKPSEQKRLILKYYEAGLLTSGQVSLAFVIHNLKHA